MSKSHGLKHKSVIITHGDVDGMVCAAQLIRRENSDCDLYFSNARYIKSKLQEICRYREYPEKLYITDIPLNNDAAAVVQQLVKKGVKIFWIDHHPVLEKKIIARLKQVCDSVIYNEAMSTPAGVLLGQWLAGEDPYFDRIGQICYAYEKGDAWERNWFRLLSAYLGKADTAVLERLAYNLDFTKEDLNTIEKQVEIEKLSEDMLGKKPHTEQTKKGKTMAVYDTTKTPGIYLGHKVFNHHSVDYCLIRILDRKWQIASNPTSGLTLRALLGKHNLDGIKIIVAGRPDELLAIELEGYISSHEIHDKIIDWVKKLL